MSSHLAEGALLCFPNQDSPLASWNPKKALTFALDHLPARPLPVHHPTSHTPPERRRKGTITTSPQPHLSNSVSMALLTFFWKLNLPFFLSAWTSTTRIP
ncbi:hypothetical protein AMECASPLE_029747 [Ameca splendens]|uniref:Uncharacterized protein n=1 Tax=Ameca splendens TaxID=208324 RepID=A0ABV0Y5U0_9TELE